MTFQSRNPYTGEIYEEYPFLNDPQLQSKLNEVALVYKYNELSLTDRLGFVASLAQILRDQKEQLATLITREMGKIIAESRGEIEKCAVLCDYYVKNAENFLQDQRLNENAKLVYQPLGMVLGIMPWNFPFWQVFRFAVPAIISGNAVLVKHAPNVPTCAIAIEEVFKKAGFGALYTNLFISVEKVQLLIRGLRIKGVSLTGSTVAGKKVAARAGQYLKKVVLELGGSDPFIVLKDADIQKAAQAGLEARILNCGQSCISPKRFILLESIYDEFVGELLGKVHHLKGGDPFDEQYNYGPLAMSKFVEQLQQQVHDSVRVGATILHQENATTNFFHPTILENIPTMAPAYREELFGPVFSLFKVKDVDEAVQLANKNDYGLGASVWSHDAELANEVALKMETGSVFINDWVKSDPALPFGGIKQSGLGKELGELGLKEFTNCKIIRNI